MGKSGIVLFILSLIIQAIFAQEPLTVEQKMFFGQDGKLYVNKNLGLHVWLSSSPDENSKKIMLKSDSTKEYSNPMFLDTEGYNTFRSPSAVDPETKKTIFPLRDIIFEVYADGLAPKTSLKLNFSKSRYSQKKLYYSGNIYALLKASDAVSGVNNIYYSINQAAYKTYSDTIKLNSEGNYILKFYSTDKVGNIEEPVIKNFIIDNSAPTTTFEIKGKNNDNYYSPDSKIVLSSKDSLSSVSHIYYKVNNGSYRTYSQAIPASILSSENGVISYYAIDIIGNKEEVQFIGGSGNAATDSGDRMAFEFYVDKEAPSFEFNTNGSFSSGKYNYVSPSTVITINASDDKSGVADINYSINSTKLDQEYNDSIEFTGEGIAYIRVEVNDYVGNTSPVQTKAFFVDAKAPSSNAIIGSPKKKVSDTLFITSSTKISLSAKDNASGTKQKVYSIDNGETINYESAFTLADSGLHIISYWAIDNVDNSGEPKTVEVFIDNQAPEIYHHYSTSAIGEKTVREEVYTIYPSNVQLYIAATDVDAGGERIEYKINNGSIKTSIPIKGFVAGNYEVSITAYDALGNASTEIVKFAVEK